MARCVASAAASFEESRSAGVETILQVGEGSPDARDEFRSRITRPQNALHDDGREDADSDFLDPEERELPRHLGISHAVARNHRRPSCRKGERRMDIGSGQTSPTLKATIKPTSRR